MAEGIEREAVTSLIVVAIRLALAAYRLTRSVPAKSF